MGRPKNFSRNQVLERAIPLFWRRGYADTSMQDLEKVTGVNKSGLYSEFKNKEDLFLASLLHYLKALPGKDILTAEPLGWGNVEKLLQQAGCRDGLQGCFGVNSIRELAVLPVEANEILSKSRAYMKKLLAQNVAVEKTKMDPVAVAELISTFFSGLSLEQNLAGGPEAAPARVADFMTMLKRL